MDGALFRKALKRANSASLTASRSRCLLQRGRGRAHRLRTERGRDVRDALEREAAVAASEGELALPDPALGQRIELEAHAEAVPADTRALGQRVRVEALRDDDALLVAEDGVDDQSVERDLGVVHRLGEPEADRRETGLGILVRDLVGTGQMLENFLLTIT